MLALSSLCFSCSLHFSASSLVCSLKSWILSLTNPISILLSSHALLNSLEFFTILYITNPIKEKTKRNIDPKQPKKIFVSVLTPACRACFTTRAWLILWSISIVVPSVLTPACGACFTTRAWWILWSISLVVPSVLTPACRACFTTREWWISSVSISISSPSAKCAFSSLVAEP